MAVIAPSGDGTNTGKAKNNGGTIVNGGNVASNSAFTKVIPLTTLADDVGQSFGSVVVANDGTGANTTDRAGVAKAVAAGTLAYQAKPTEWVVRGIATKLGGVANTVLLNKGSEYDSSVLKDNIFQTTHTHALGSGALMEINLLARPDGTINPAFTKPENAGYEVQFVKASGYGTLAATDDAATPTRAVPGELTYRTGASLPTSVAYKAKDAYES